MLSTDLSVVCRGGLVSNRPLSRNLWARDTGAVVGSDLRGNIVGASGVVVVSQDRWERHPAALQRTVSMICRVVRDTPSISRECHAQDRPDGQP